MKKIKLKEVLKVKRGTSLSGNYYSEKGNMIRLTLGNFNYPGGGFKDNISKNDIYFTGNVKDEFILKKGDIITPLTEQVSGLLGETATIPESNKYIQSGDIGLIIPNESKIDKRFCYYLVSSPIVKKQLDAGAQQTKIRHTSPDKIMDCIAWIPDTIEQQRKISCLLDKINNKIRNNIQINDNLEKLLGTIYQRWFIEFEFPDKDGKPYKSSGGKLVYNEQLKQEIPKKWNNCKLTDISDFISGYAFSSEDYCDDGNYKLYTIKNVQDGSIISIVDNKLKELPNNMPKECLLKPKDLIMSLTGNVGRVGLVYEDNALLNQRVLKINPKDNLAFLYSLFRNEYMKARCEKISSGTSQKNLSPIELGKTQIAYSEEIIKLFEIQNKDLINLFVNNLVENQKLTELKEYLLPLLMNGQINVDDIKI